MVPCVMALQGVSGLGSAGEAGHSVIRQGMAWLAWWGTAWQVAAGLGEVRIGRLGGARRGLVRIGMAWQAGLGSLGSGWSTQCQVSLGPVWQARPGPEWFCVVVKVGCGKVREAGGASYGTFWRGFVRPGGTRSGMAGEVRSLRIVRLGSMG